jgi:hypothetical protein
MDNYLDTNGIRLRHLAYPGDRPTLGLRSFAVLGRTRDAKADWDVLFRITRSKTRLCQRYLSTPKKGTER